MGPALAAPAPAHVGAVVSDPDVRICAICNVPAYYHPPGAGHEFEARPDSMRIVDKATYYHDIGAERLLPVTREEFTELSERVAAIEAGAGGLLLALAMEYLEGRHART